MGPHATPPSHIIMRSGRPVMFRGLQAATTTISKSLCFKHTIYGTVTETLNALANAVPINGHSTDQITLRSEKCRQEVNRLGSEVTREKKVSVSGHITYHCPEGNCLYLVPSTFLNLRTCEFICLCC